MSDENTLQINADMNNLGLVVGFVEEVAVRLGASPQAALDMVQAVDEVVTNVIMHGYRGDPGTIDIEVSGNGQRLVVRVSDHAPQFDPTSVPPRPSAARLEDCQTGGLGLPMVRAFCHELSYRPLPEGGNELTLVVRIRDE